MEQTFLYIIHKPTLAENLAEITRRLESIEKELTTLKTSLHDLKQERETLKTKEETKNKLLLTEFSKYLKYIGAPKNETKEYHLDFIARQLMRRLDLDPKETKRARSVIERCFDTFKFGTIYSPDIEYNNS